MYDTILSYLLWYMVCGAIASGIFNAYMQKEYPQRAAEFTRAGIGRVVRAGIAVGPLGLFMALIFSKGAKYGIHWNIP